MMLVQLCYGHMMDACWFMQHVKCSYSAIGTESTRGHTAETYTRAVHKGVC